MNLYMYRGDTRIFKCIAKSQDGVVVNLGTTDIYFTVKRELSDPDASALITKDSVVPDGITKTDNVNGEFEIKISPADTSDLTGTFYYDIELRMGTDVYTVDMGKLSIMEDVRITL